MKTFLSLFLIIFFANCINANVLKSLFSGYNEENDQKAVVSVQQAAYKPEKVEKQPIIVKKKVAKTEWKEKCTIKFGKSDILMLTILKDPIAYPSDKSLAYPLVVPTSLVLDPKSIELTYYYNKKKPIKSAKELMKTLIFSKKGELKKLPIDLTLDQKVEKLLPPISENDKVILTIITKSKKGKNKVKSHFVNSISVISSHYNNFIKY